jgi:hypothetical protein
MTWLDHTLAAPVVGCTFRPSFQSSQEYIAALRPLLKKWREKSDLEISEQTPLSLSINSKTGFNYSFESDKFAVRFQYAVQIKPKPGQIPSEIENGPDVRKYSELLASIIEEYCEVFDHIVGSESRGLQRLGIVANCRLDGRLLPPGVARFAKYLARPWGGSLAKCQAHLLGNIAETEKTRDRCHHQIDMDDDRKDDVRFTLDWQRSFISEIELGRGKLLREQFKKCSAAAVDYFERWGKGDLDYGDAN